MNVLIVSDLTLESQVGKIISNHEINCDFLFTENIHMELAQIQLSNDLDVVLIYFDTYFKKYAEEKICSILHEVKLLSIRFEKKILCSNLLETGWEVKPIQKNTTTDLSFYKNRNTLIDDISTIANVNFIDLKSALNEIGKDNAYNFRLGHLYQMPYTKAAINKIGQTIQRTVLNFIRADKKVIVLDCDNTLWKGIVGEDGIDGIKCNFNHDGIQYLHFQEFLKTRQIMGFILCLCSKNNFEDVENVFKNKKMPLDWDDFVIKKINWEPKNKNIESIANELNLGLESFIFIDDSDFEVMTVKENLPEVSVFKMINQYEDMLSLTQNIEFNKKFITKEDLSKTEQYQIEQKRIAEISKKISNEDYLDALQIELIIEENPFNELTRISQLTEKTNQFNFNKKFFSEDELRQAILLNNFKCYSLKVTDKFGDYGLVGLIFINILQSSIQIENYILSCRVLGRGIESKFWNLVLEKIKKDFGQMRLEICFSPTSKNIPALNFYNQINKAYEF
jgi:FkbH-like protein